MKQGGFVALKVFQKEHANHSCKTPGSPEALISATILKKCGVKTSSAWQECHILKNIGAPHTRNMTNLRDMRANAVNLKIQTENYIISAWLD